MLSLTSLELLLLGSSIQVLLEKVQQAGPALALHLVQIVRPLQHRNI